jgi:hypothetical protein
MIRKMLIVVRLVHEKTAARYRVPERPIENIGKVLVVKI